MPITVHSPEYNGFSQMRKDYDNTVSLDTIRRLFGRDMYHRLLDSLDNLEDEIPQQLGDPRRYIKFSAKSD